MLKGKAILVLEDNVFLALDLSSQIEDMEGRVVGPVSTATEAFQLLATREITAAVIDCDLVDGELPRVIMHLAERAIPVVLHTSSGPPPELIDILPDVPVLLEPVHTKTVVARLAREIERRTGAMTSC